MSAALSVGSSVDTLRRTLSGSARACGRSKVRLLANGAAETSAVNEHGFELLKAFVALQEVAALV